ncbi:MAG: hypothetical protein AAF787_17375, partial [Chloroflexota bacterium]
MTGRLYFVLAVLLLIAVPVAFAQDDTPAAEIINDDGGVQTITGELAYTFGFFNSLWRDPYVIIYNDAGSIDRDIEYTASLESQYFGLFTTDTRESPISYQLSLPIAPDGDFRDVDNDDTEDTGIQFYVPAITDNLWGDPFIIERDGFFLGYASLVYSDDAATL